MARETTALVPQLTLDDDYRTFIPVRSGDGAGAQSVRR